MLTLLITNGLTIGAIYALIALGLVILIRSLDIFNFLQGETVMGGAFLGVLFYMVLKLPFLISFFLSILVMGIIGGLVERLAINPLKNPTPNNMIVATIAVSVIFQNLAVLMGGPEPLILDSPVKDIGITIVSEKIPLHNILVIGMAIVIMILLQFFFLHTKAGICIRAVMTDRQGAQMMGIKVSRMITLTFAISSALGAAAGVLVGPITYVSFDMGSIALKSFAAAIAGGMFSFVGSIIAGFSLGILENLISFYLTTAYRDVISYGLIVCILLIRPQGLFAKK